MEKKKIALPGDTVAIPEEFLPGKNVYEADDSLKALMLGEVVKDLKSREVRVRPYPESRALSVGDVVTGLVEVAQTNSAAIRVEYANGRPAPGGFVGTLSLRMGRSARGERPTLVMLGDIVRARVVSMLNGIIQFSIDEPHLGVVFSRCSNCSRPLIRDRGRAKCSECGNMEERKFADDFGSEVIEP